MESQVSTEKEQLSHQNTQMRNLLSDALIDLDDNTLRGTPPTSTPFAIVDVHQDALTGHDCLFLDALTCAPTDAVLPVSESDQDTWIIIDFILSLEWPCRHHIPHPILRGADKQSDPQAEPEFHGHGLTMTSLVANSTFFLDQLQPPPPPQMPSREGIDEQVLRQWQIPHAEIEKYVHILLRKCCLSSRLPFRMLTLCNRLIELAGKLELDYEYTTPAQAYAAIKTRCYEQSQLRALLPAMKGALMEIMHCEAFGAVVETQRFEETLELVLMQYEEVMQQATIMQV